MENGWHKEDNRARHCHEQRVRSEPWPGGRQTHVQKQKTRGSSCLWFLGSVFGCRQSEVIDYRIRLVLFWPCDFRCCNLSPLCAYPCSEDNSLGAGTILGGDTSDSFSPNCVCNPATPLINHQANIKLAVCFLLECCEFSKAKCTIV